MICVTILPASGRLLVFVVIKPPAAPAWASATTLANLSPIGTMVMPFMPRIISRATMASERVRGVSVLRAMVASFDPVRADGPLLARNRVRPTKSA